MLLMLFAPAANLQLAKLWVADWTVGPISVFCLPSFLNVLYGLWLMDGGDKSNRGSLPSGLSSNQKHTLTSAQNQDCVRWVDRVRVRFCSVTLVFFFFFFAERLKFQLGGSSAAAVVPNYAGFYPRWTDVAAAFLCLRSNFTCGPESAWWVTCIFI